MPAANRTGTEERSTAIRNPQTEVRSPKSEASPSERFGSEPQRAIRKRAPRATLYPGGAPKTNDTLWPPKPNEFVIAVAIDMCRASFGT